MKDLDQDELQNESKKSKPILIIKDLKTNTKKLNYFPESNTRQQSNTFSPPRDPPPHSGEAFCKKNLKRRTGRLQRKFYKINSNDCSTEAVFWKSK